MDSNAYHKAPNPPILALRSYIYVVRSIPRLTREDRWRGSRCLKPTFLGRSLTPPTADLDYLTLGQDSMGTWSYAFIESAIQ